MRRSSRTTYAAALSACLAVCGLSACVPPVDRALAAMDDAIRLIHSTPTNFQSYLDNLIVNLHGEADYLLGQLAMLRDGAIASATSGALCVGEYGAAEVERALSNIRIINWLIEEEPLPPRPIACNANPASVDLDIGGGPNTVYISGFDFNPRAFDPRLPPVEPPRVTIERANGQRQVLPPKLVTVWPFQISLNIDRDIVPPPLPSDAISIDIDFDGDSADFSIVVNPAHAPDPPLMLSNLRARFITGFGSDGKDDNSLLSVNIHRGGLTWLQPALDFWDAPSERVAPLTPSTFPVSELQGSDVTLCFADWDGDDEWGPFTMRLEGDASDGRVLWVQFDGLRVSDSSCASGILLPNPLLLRSPPPPPPDPPADDPDDPRPPPHGCRIQSDDAAFPQLPPRC